MTHYLIPCPRSVADPGQAFGGGGGKSYLRQSLGITQKWLPFVGHKVAIFVGRAIRVFGE